MLFRSFLGVLAMS